jgi:cysteinyl-tRNA synthetase
VTLKLYNTRTRTKEEFQPLDPGNVRMYVCGPTVYDYAHIGNARPVIVFDVLYRLLRHLYGESHVTYVRNITDVDDKINARAAEQYPDLPLNDAIRKLTEETAAQYHRDVAALGCLPPTHEPRATEYIEQMKAMVEALLDRGCAYVAENHVLFHVSAMPDYGQLARRSLDEMRAGARVEVAPYKRDPMDFVLWKPSKDGEPSWPSPRGINAPGRPGWHLECSAMSKALLGETFDIHGGGIDLVFPHHENEVAQSRCAHDTDIMAKVWMHNGHLQVEGAKMSKSDGNFVTIHELLQDWPGPVLRLNMLRTHYRQPMDWTVKGLRESELILRRWHSEGLSDEDWLNQTDGFGDPWGLPDGSGYGGGNADGDFLPALFDDLNTPLAIAIVYQMEAKQRAAALSLLGLAGGLADPRKKQVDAFRIHKSISARLAARKAKNWAEADRIRDELAAMGITLKDAKNPETGEIETTWEIAR